MQDRLPEIPWGDRSKILEKPLCGNRQQKEL
jgi:hypothetical protein